jgi:mRNA-degrading endonuclease RelE of RelBE toxin-antitoxin system
MKKSVLKGLKKLPPSIRDTFFLLVKDLEDEGPTQHRWPNYSKLGKKKYHCHLTRSWVACWEYEKGDIKIEVYYAGSREKAPY